MSKHKTEEEADRAQGILSPRIGKAACIEHTYEVEE